MIEAQMKFEKAASEKFDEEDNFYTVIDKAKHLLKSNEWWSVEEKEKFLVIND